MVTTSVACDARRAGDVAALAADDQRAAGPQPVVQLGEFDLVAVHVLAERLVGQAQRFAARVHGGVPDVREQDVELVQPRVGEE